MLATLIENSDLIDNGINTYDFNYRIVRFQILDFKILIIKPLN
jgi:hypothetical protein